jgi:hypothetical protein
MDVCTELLRDGRHGIARSDGDCQCEGCCYKAPHGQCWGPFCPKADASASANVVIQGDVRSILTTGDVEITQGNVENIVTTGDVKVHVSPESLDSGFEASRIEAESSPSTLYAPAAAPFLVLLLAGCLALIVLASRARAAMISTSHPYSQMM